MSGSGISWAICKCAPRSRQITTPAPHRSVFLQAGCPSGFLPPNQQHQRTEGISVVIIIISGNNYSIRCLNKFCVFLVFLGGSLPHRKGDRDAAFCQILCTMLNMQPLYFSIRVFSCILLRFLHALNFLAAADWHNKSYLLSSSCYYCGY